ncbi:MAG TPA: DUF1345 domain-containing protein [Polyangia bacterium]|nr:DUF1345 domain-containing protein [Polyangia bacterium]
MPARAIGGAPTLDAAPLVGEAGRMGQRLRALPRHIPPHAHGRLLLATLLGLGTALAMPARLGLVVRALGAWDVAALVMVAFAWIIILHAGPGETHHHAGTHDPGRRAVGVLVVVGSAVSLLATAVILRQARGCPASFRWLFVVLCILAVASAWLLTHSAYALRYAHLYYRDDDEGVGGLTFPDEAAPCYLDFAYFAFTIGMCFQVSDVSVPSRQIRRAVLGHSMLSFLYNTAILATAINLAVGVFG